MEMCFRVAVKGSALSEPVAPVFSLAGADGGGSAARDADDRALSDPGGKRKKGMDWWARVHLHVRTYENADEWFVGHA